jgi:hypothetical protein
LGPEGSEGAVGACTWLCDGTRVKSSERSLCVHCVHCVRRVGPVCCVGCGHCVGGSVCVGVWCVGCSRASVTSSSLPVSSGAEPVGSSELHFVLAWVGEGGGGGGGGGPGWREVKR